MRLGTSIIGSAFYVFSSLASSFEMSVLCTPNETAPLYENYAPRYYYVNVGQSTRSRFVLVGLMWGFPEIPTDKRFAGWLVDKNLGFEVKTYFYNYDDAAATNYGPAYVVGPSGYWWCSIPGCYVDSDFASETNSVGEYREPQVAFGMAPGNASSLVYDAPPNGYYSRTYAFMTRATAGRGNRSLMKVRFLVTKTVIPGAGVSGYFLCEDTPYMTLVNFLDRVYAPACIRTGYGAQFPTIGGPPSLPYLIGGAD